MKMAALTPGEAESVKQANVASWGDATRDRTFVKVREVNSAAARSRWEIN